MLKTESIHQIPPRHASKNLDELLFWHRRRRGRPSARRHDRRIAAVRLATGASCGGRCDAATFATLDHDRRESLLRRLEPLLGALQLRHQLVALALDGAQPFGQRIDVGVGVERATRRARTQRRHRRRRRRRIVGEVLVAVRVKEKRNRGEVQSVVVVDVVGVRAAVAAANGGGGVSALLLLCVAQRLFELGNALLQRLIASADRRLRLCERHISETQTVQEADLRYQVIDSQLRRATL